jgi:hypothetical protein
VLVRTADTVDNSHQAGLPHPEGFKLLERYCAPFRFSNDVWSPDAVRDLQVRLQEQHANPETSAALVVGSGGLPYLLSHLSTRKIFGIDLSDEVISATLGRIGQMSQFNSWDDYHDHAAVDAKLQISKYLRDTLMLTNA